MIRHPGPGPLEGSGPVWLTGARPAELIIQRIGAHAIIRYGASCRVLPLATLQTRRGARVVARVLWDAECAPPYVERLMGDWSERRLSAVEDLATRIAALVQLAPPDLGGAVPPDVVDDDARDGPPR